MIDYELHVHSQSLLNNFVDSARSGAAAKIKGSGTAFDVVSGARGRSA